MILTIVGKETIIVLAKQKNKIYGEEIIMKKISCGLLCILLILVLSACSCKHEWAEATCTEPKTCTKCGETEGEALGHDWGDWEIEKRATAAAEGTKISTCSRCGETKTESYKIESFIENGHLLLTPAEFCERLTEKLYCQKAQLKENGSEMAAAVKGVGGFDSKYEEDEPIAAIFFADAEKVLGAGENDNGSVKILYVHFYTEDQSKIAHTMMGIIETCDGSVDTTAAGKIGKAIVSAYEKNDVCHGDGINYGLTKRNGSYEFAVTIE